MLCRNQPEIRLLILERQFGSDSADTSITRDYLAAQEPEDTQQKERSMTRTTQNVIKRADSSTLILITSINASSFHPSSRCMIRARDFVGPPEVCSSVILSQT